MKKTIPISLTLLILTAVLHLSIATHYCHGNETAMKVSLTGKLADCGMGSSEKVLPVVSGTYFSKHCCDDVIIFCGIDSNYTPSFSIVPESFQYIFQVFPIHSGIHVNPCTDLIPLYTNVSPPGALMSTNVDLSDICIFRI